MEHIKQGEPAPNPFPPGSGGNPNPPVQCAHEPDEQGKCKKCGRWGQFFQGVGEALGEWKFGE